LLQGPTPHGHARNALTGGLTFLGGEAQQGERVRLSPDDAHVYVASGSTTVGVFRMLDVACAPTPLPACKLPTLPRRAAVRWKGGSPSDRLFDWKWKVGEQTDLAEFGDPINALDDFIICAYDASGSSQPIFRTNAPAGGICDERPCWKTSGSTVGRRKLKYKDRSRRPDGLDKLDLKEGVAGAASVKAKGKDSFLGVPALPLTPPVRVQLQAATGSCWEAVFSTPTANDVLQFKAKAD